MARTAWLMERPPGLPAAENEGCPPGGERASPAGPGTANEALPWSRGGELDGERIQEATVDAAFTDQIGDLDFPAEIPTADPAITDTLYAGPGWKWGCGLMLNTEDLPGARRAGSGAEAGLFNTHFFIDRTTGICASIYTNSLPFIPKDGAWRAYGEFEKALYASL